MDWLYAHDPTTLFAGIALRARQRFGIAVRQVHVDATSFSVSGEYLTSAESVTETAGGEAGDREGDVDARAIAISYGYSHDRRADLKQWMLALATTREGDAPLFLRPLDGNSSDAVSLVAAVEALQEQLRADSENPQQDGDTAAPGARAAEPSLFVADGGLYSEANLTRLNAAGVAWVSRVPSTLSVAKAAQERAEVAWQTAADGQTYFWSQQLQLGQGPERWCIVRTQAGEERVRADSSTVFTLWLSMIAALGSRSRSRPTRSRSAR